MSGRTCATCGASIRQANKSGYCGKHFQSSPAVVASKSRSAKERRLWEQGAPHAAKPEVRARAGRSLSERRLSWCPMDLRADYLNLIHKTKMPAAEARALIEKQARANEARLTQSLAVQDYADDNGKLMRPVVAIARGSTALLAALQRAHPERCAA